MPCFQVMALEQAFSVVTICKLVKLSILWQHFISFIRDVRESVCVLFSECHRFKLYFLNFGS